MSAAYHEYLELFEYFGRGHERLQQLEFDVLRGEFEHLLAAGPGWTREQVARIVELRDLLLRDRPHLRELTQKGRP